MDVAFILTFSDLLLRPSGANNENVPVDRATSLRE